ncbi:MAG TPA: insulinase family protein [Kiritimatiellae bacterium]|nr:insulinase family protein [Kiritimatiellia bacterium]
MLAAGSAGAFLLLSGCTRLESQSTDLVNRLERQLADVRREVLPNGMVCLLKPDPHAPVVAIQIWVRNGSIHEDDYLGAGISHAIEHMIFKGTAARPPGAIAREISACGGRVNAYTSLDRTVFHAAIPSRYWHIGLDALADAMKNAAFPAEEWKKERNVILHEMAMNRDNPDRMLSRLLWTTAFLVHPYRYPVIGYERPFRSLRADDLRSFFRRSYRPDNTIVVVSGDFNADEAAARVRNAFADFHRRRIYPPRVPSEPVQAAPRQARRHGPYRLARVALAFHTVAFSDPAAPALDMLAVVASRGRSSRLMKRLREDTGLAHEVTAWSYTGVYPGLFAVEAVLDPTNMTALLDEMEKEIHRWREEGFRPEEILRARRAIVVDELSRYQSVDGTAEAIAAGEFYAGDPAYSVTYIRRVMNTSAGDLREVARRFLVPENSTIASLLPEGTHKSPAVGTACRERSGYPKVRREKLPNGVRLLTREDHRLPFVYVCVAFRGGLLSESASQAGLCYLTSQMLVRGTRQRDARTLARLLDSMAATLEPFAGANSFGLRGRCLSRDLNAFIDLVADCLVDPIFPPAELEKARRLQMAAIAEQRERPFHMASLHLRRLMFGEHPYAHDPLGDPATVAKLRREDLVDYFRYYVRGGNCVVAVFGDVRTEQPQEVFARAFGRIPGGGGAIPPRPPAFTALPGRCKQRFPAQQAIVLLGYPAVTVTSRMADAAIVIQESLNGMASELFEEIREKRALVYYAGAALQLGLDPALLALYAGTDLENADAAAGILRRQAQKLAREGLSPAAVDMAKKRLVASHHMQLQDTAEIALHCALDELYGLGHDHFFRFEERIASVDSNLLKSTAAVIFGSGKEASSVLLPDVGAESRSKTQTWSSEEADEQQPFQ